MTLGIEDKCAIVTGAGRGIGRQISRDLAAAGCSVVICDIDEDRALQVANEIAGESDAEAMPAVCDVTDRAAVERMMTKSTDRFGGVEILVNNAGIPAAINPSEESGLDKSWFSNSEPEQWPRTLSLITYGVLNCTHAVLPSMERAGWGRVVNIASDAGRIGEPTLACYSMAKAGVIGFSKALAKEVARDQITVNCVSPAFVVTEATRTRVDEHRDKIVKQYPLGRGSGRLGEPNDISGAVLYLASESARWITGQVLSVNGGYCMVD